MCASNSSCNSGSRNFVSLEQQAACTLQRWPASNTRRSRKQALWEWQHVVQSYVRHLLSARGHIYVMCRAVSSLADVRKRCISS
jgi:hypothetical protein